MTDLSKFDAAINAAYRAGDESSFRALKALREQVQFKPKPIYRINVVTEKGTFTGEATAFLVMGDDLHFKDSRKDEAGLAFTGVKHYSIEEL